MDDQQFSFISDMVTSSSLKSMGPETSKNPVFSESNNFQVDQDTAIMESKISQVRDLFPDYGKGFIVACLEIYDQNPEEVIQRILDGTLHPDLLNIDRAMEKISSPGSTSRVTSSKGKEVLSLTDSLPSIPSSSSSSSATPTMGQPSSSSSSVIGQSSLSGKFIRKNEYEYVDSEILDLRTAKDSVRAAVLEAQYDDEYDDSFDELGLSVVESGTEEVDISDNRIKSLPDKTLNSGGPSKWQTRSQPQYYVKDGKNYSYKVAGSVPVVNTDEAALVNQAQRELIHGLGQGGNFPLGAVRKLTESDEREDESEELEASGSGRGNLRGRGGRRGGGDRHHRKDRALRKAFAGLTTS